MMIPIIGYYIYCSVIYSDWSGLCRARSKYIYLFKEIMFPIIVSYIQYDGGLDMLKLMNSAVIACIRRF